MSRASSRTGVAASKGVDVLKTDLSPGEVAAGANDGQPQGPDEVLLRALASLIQEGQAPTAKEVLERAKNDGPRAFPHWSPKGAANALRRYGIQTHRSNGRRSYGRVEWWEVEAALCQCVGWLVR